MSCDALNGEKAGLDDGDEVGENMQMKMGFVCWSTHWMDIHHAHCLSLVPQKPLHCNCLHYLMEDGGHRK